jgi:hypothetical protein
VSFKERRGRRRRRRRRRGRGSESWSGRIQIAKSLHFLEEIVKVPLRLHRIRSLKLLSSLSLLFLILQFARKALDDVERKRGEGECGETSLSLSLLLA